MRICNTGLNLGQAEARNILFGRAFSGAIPADQLADIATNLANASAEIMAAEALFQEPFFTERSRKGYATNATSKIATYASRAPTMSYSHKANYIKNIYANYRTSLSYTFVSSRPGAFQWNPNCDSLILKVCYNYGRATIASTVGGNFARSYQSGAIGSMNDAIRAGLSVAMDIGHRPYDGHARKICCTFGAPPAWAALPNFQPTSPLSLYAGNQIVLQNIVNGAVALDPVCRSSGYSYCASSAYSRYQPTPHPYGGSFTGNWNTGQWGTLTMTQSGNRITGSYTHQGGRIIGTVVGRELRGTWSEDPKHRPPDDAGDFVFTLSPDGRSFDGRWRYDSSGSWKEDWDGTRK